MGTGRVSQELQDAETRILIHALAKAPLITDEESGMTECLFCGHEMPENQIKQLSDFQHSPYCHVVRAMNWLSTHAVVESEGPKVIRLEQAE